MGESAIHFFLAGSDADIAGWRDFVPDREPQRLVLGEHYWVVLSYCRLRDAGVPVQLVNRVPAHGVVIFYAGDKRPVWKALKAGSQALAVALRSDRNPVGFADLEIVQNQSSADRHRCHHLPHWPQPGLVPRDPARGDRPRVILFPGTPQNLHDDFRSARWQDYLQANGLEFRCHEGRPGQPPAWHDCHDIDVMLAIRPTGNTLVRNKPAWKLFNAWLAGMPAILGPESGYRELREDPLDYIEAGDLDTVIAALDRWLGEPAQYRAMIAHGQRRGLAFTSAATCRQWRDLNDGVLVPAAAQQQRHPVTLWQRQWRELRAKLRRALRGKA